MELDDAGHNRANDADSRRPRKRDSFRGASDAEYPAAPWRYDQRAAGRPDEAGQRSFEVQPDAGLAAPPSSLDSEFYATIAKVASQEFSNAPVVPFMSSGATDSAQLRLHNVQAYGVSPFPLTEEDSRRMHADDERIPLASFDKGVDFITRLVAEFAAMR